eukprot:7276372-Prymnesium_polylepis.3
MLPPAPALPPALAPPVALVPQNVKGGAPLPAMLGPTGGGPARVHAAKWFVIFGTEVAGLLRPVGGAEVARLRAVVASLRPPVTSAGAGFDCLAVHAVEVR